MSTNPCSPVSAASDNASVRCASKRGHSLLRHANSASRASRNGRFCGRPARTGTRDGGFYQ